jgi:hypothetical protein
LSIIFFREHPLPAGHGHHGIACCQCLLPFVVTAARQSWRITAIILPPEECTHHHNHCLHLLLLFFALQALLFVDAINDEEVVTHALLLSLTRTCPFSVPMLKVTMIDFFCHFPLPIFLISAIVVIVSSALSLNTIAAMKLLSTPDDDNNNAAAQIKIISYLLIGMAYCQILLTLP